MAPQQTDPQSGDDHQTAPGLATDAARLRDMVHQIAGHFPAEPRVTIDGRYDPQMFGSPMPRRRSAGWEYNVRLTASPNAADVVQSQVIPDMTNQGWRVTDRSSDREYAYQFSRDGFNLGVHVARGGGGDVVVGGSSPPRPLTG